MRVKELERKRWCVFVYDEGYGVFRTYNIFSNEDFRRAMRGVVPSREDFRERVDEALWKCFSHGAHLGIGGAGMVSYLSVYEQVHVNLDGLVLYLRGGSEK